MTKSLSVDISLAFPLCCETIMALSGEGVFSGEEAVEGWEEAFCSSKSCFSIESIVKYRYEDVWVWI